MGLPVADTKLPDGHPSPRLYWKKQRPRPAANVGYLADGLAQ
jgi:hypothetical protein